MNPGTVPVWSSGPGSASPLVLPKAEDTLMTFHHPVPSGSGTVFLPLIPEDDTWTTMPAATCKAYRDQIAQFTQFDGG